MNSQIGALCNKLKSFNQFMGSGEKTEKGRDNGERQGLLGSSPGKPNQSTH